MKTRRRKSRRKKCGKERKKKKSCCLIESHEAPAAKPPANELSMSFCPPRIVSKLHVTPLYTPRKPANPNEERPIDFATANTLRCTATGRGAPPPQELGLAVSGKEASS